MKRAEVTIPLHKPNTNEMLFFFTCGLVMSIPLTLFIYQYTDAILVGLDPFTVSLISAVFFAPFIEEFSKAYPLFYRHGETERSIFNLAVLVGLGFGLVELLTYVFVVNAPLIERLPGLLFHPASTSITAYGIATKRPLPFYMAAVGLHFSNNFLAITNPLPFSGSIFIVGITLLISWQLHDKTKEKIVA
jgi:RsiW-degrading membrane proteinase PrsW (M82 family)